MKTNPFSKIENAVNYGQGVTLTRIEAETLQEYVNDLWLRYQGLYADYTHLLNDFKEFLKTLSNRAN